MVRCETCGAAFEPKHRRGRFCSGRCRVAAWHERRVKAARAPVERALVTLAGLAEALVERERAALEGRRAVLADLEGAVQEAREALTGRKGPTA